MVALMIFHLSVSQDFGGSGDDFAGSGDGNGFKATSIIIPAKAINPVKNYLHPGLIEKKPNIIKPMVPKKIRKRRVATTNNKKNKPFVPHDIPIWHES